MMQGSDPAQSAGMFPSADPAFIAQIFGQVLQAQQMDQAKLAAAQHAAVVQNPLMAALLGGDASGTAVGAPQMTPGEAVPAPQDQAVA